MSWTPCAARRRLTDARWRITSRRRRGWDSRSTGRQTLSFRRSFRTGPTTPARSCAIFSWRSDSHRPHARRSGVLRRARVADPHLVQGAPARGVRADELVGFRRRRAAVGVVPEVPRRGHNALAGGRQGAQGEHAHHRRRVRSAHAHDPQSERGIDRSGARRTDESRLDRSMARLSRIERRAVRQETRKSRKSCARGDGSPASPFAREESARSCVATTTCRPSRSSASPR